jgi:hypothetical protein
MGGVLSQAIYEGQGGRNQAIFAALMLGEGKSRGYCLEMICADFLAGAHLESSNEDTLFFALTRLIGALADEQKLRLLEMMREDVEPILAKAAAATA